MMVKLKEKQAINQLVISEDIAHGERVREFVVEGKTTKGWQVLTKGQSIGHKFITTFDEVVVSSVRLVVSKSTLRPIIKDISLYRI